MKKILIPTLLTTTLAPIITTTSCGDKGWIKWDFKKNENYQYDGQMLIPSQEVSPSDASSSYLKMVESDPKNFVHEYMLSRSLEIKQKRLTLIDLTILQWIEQLKIDSFDIKQQRISFEVKADKEWIQTDYNPEQMVEVFSISLDLVCKNIPLTSYVNIAARNPVWRIGTGIDYNFHSLDYDEIRERLKADHRWEISGSLSYYSAGESNARYQTYFADSNFTYNYKTAENDVFWEKQEYSHIKRCCCFAYTYINHDSFYLTNTPIVS